MERFAEVNAQDQDGKTPLHISCTLGNLSLAKLFMSREDCIVSMQDNNGDTPLHIACNQLNDPIIRFLLQSGRADLSV